MLFVSDGDVFYLVFVIWRNSSRRDISNGGVGLYIFGLLLLGSVVCKCIKGLYFFLGIKFN